MSSAVSNSELDNMLFDTNLSVNICNKILDTIKFEGFGIILNKEIYHKLVKVFIIDNKNKDINLIEDKINKLFEPLSLKCWISTNNNTEKIIYKINFNMEYIKNENLNNINIYTCLNMIKNYINNSSNNIKEIKIPVKLYDYLIIYISKQKEKYDNYFETEYQDIVEFFSDNKIDLILKNKTSNENENDKDYYEIIFSKFDTNDENSIKSTSDNDNLISNDNINFPTLTDNKPTQDLKNAINYGKIRENWYDDNISIEEDDVKEDIINDEKVDVIDDVKEEVIDDVKEEVIDDVKEDIISDVKEEVIDVKEEVIDVKEEVIDVVMNKDINLNEKSVNNQLISGVCCQGQMEIEGNYSDKFVFSMNGFMNGYDMELNLCIKGLFKEDGREFKIPLNFTVPFAELEDRRNLIFSPVPNNF